MPKLTVYFEVWCTCGKGLCQFTEVDKNEIIIEPCPDCIDKSYDQGYKEGDREGYRVGFQKGTKKEY